MDLPHDGFEALTADVLGVLTIHPSMHSETDNHRRIDAVKLGPRVLVTGFTDSHQERWIGRVHFQYDTESHSRVGWRRRTSLRQLAPGPTADPELGGGRYGPPPGREPRRHQKLPRIALNASYINRVKLVIMIDCFISLIAPPLGAGCCSQVTTNSARRNLQGDGLIRR